MGRIIKRSDFDEGWLKQRAEELAEPFKVHRKLWEFCAIVNEFAHRVKTTSPKVIGFGVGTEPLPAWFASQGAAVTASDYASDTWKDGNQNSVDASSLPYEGICDSDTFSANVTFAPVDMRYLPRGLLKGQYDFSWSAGSFEHLGSRAAGLKFFCRQMGCLKPGGVAVHTTELLVDGPELEMADLSAYTRQDIEHLGEMLTRQGDRLELVDCSNENPHPDDLHVDEEPYSDEPHIRMRTCGRVLTSICLVAIRGKRQSKKSKSVLWLGDAVVSTGFARCTHAACDELAANGWNVDVIGVNYFGDPHGYPYKIWPAVAPLDGCHDMFGASRLAQLSRKLQPDVIVLLTDPWNVPQYTEQIPAGLQTVGWLAVDAKNQKGAELVDLDHVVCWTDFAKEELARGGYEGPIDLVPLGVDLSRFKPADRTACRAKILDKLPPEAFLVGCVGRNQWPRKRLDLTIEYFAAWVNESGIDDAYLYVHSAPTGERGYDIRALASHYKVSNRVIHGQPQIGMGVEDSLMRDIYGMMDVYITTTQGEGWGLPTLEAMACGVPCIVPDWSGLGSWATAAVRVPCSGTAVSAPINSKAYTLGGILDKERFVGALNALYSQEKLRDEQRAKGLALANELPWQNTGQKFRHVLESLVED